MRLTGAQLIIGFLERRGTGVVVGIPGGTVLPLYRALADSRLRHVLARHEQGAAFMAEVKADPQTYKDWSTGEWKVETDGKEGVEPPAWVGEWKDLVLEWQQHLPGSPESDDLGAKLIEAQLDQLVFIGLVEAPNPIYHSTKLENFETPKTWSYEYYRVYPYRPQQWSLTE